MIIYATNTGSFLRLFFQLMGGLNKYTIFFGKRNTGKFKGCKYLAASYDILKAFNSFRIQNLNKTLITCNT